MLSPSQKLQDLQRFRQVLRIVYEEGSAALLNEIGQLQHLPFHRRIRASRQEMPGPERARETLERLGTTYIKLGQVLSERPDIVPERYAKEFKKLQDSAPELETDAVTDIVTEEVGMDSFADFSEEPLASASVAQVHPAQLKSGEEVVVKVRRPGIETEVEKDLRILEFFAEEAERHSVKAERMRVHSLIEEFGRWTRNELDLTREARNAAEFRENNQQRDGVYVPKVYEDLTTERVLVMERIHGFKITDRDRAENAGVDTELLVENIVEQSLRQYIVDGLFHADPHASNFLVTEDGTFTYLDFGMMGRETRGRRNQMAAMLISMLNEDLEGYVSSLERICYTDEGYDRQAVKRVARRNMLEARDARPRNGGLVSVMFQMFAEASEHGLHVPNSTALVARVLATTEGIGMDVAPDFELDSRLKPVLEDCLSENNDLETSVETLASDVIRNKDIFEKAPTQLQQGLSEDREIDVSVEGQSRDNLLPAAAVLTSGVLAYRFLPREPALLISLLLGLGALTWIF
nr:MAG: putative unusual protein kinase [Candidatus Nanosalinarum sp. J07AB56]